MIWNKRQNLLVPSVHEVVSIHLLMKIVTPCKRIKVQIQIRERADVDCSESEAENKKARSARSLISICILILVTSAPGSSWLIRPWSNPALSKFTSKAIWQSTAKVGSESWILFDVVSIQDNSFRAEAFLQKFTSVSTKAEMAESRGGVWGKKFVHAK